MAQGVSPEPGHDWDADDSRSFASTGIRGLDELLGGGFPRRRLFVIEGEPGVGKTTLGLQFALEGAANGERVLHVIMSESEQETREIAHAHGWSLENVELLFQSHRDYLDQQAQQSMLHSVEVELPEAARKIRDAIDRIRPHRLVIDSLSEFRVLAGDERFYRKQILALKEYLAELGCTTLLLDARGEERSDYLLHSVASGVVKMQQFSPDFGPSRRRLQITKVRGMNCASGFHDYLIRRGGIEVFPRLIAAEHRGTFDHAVVPSGNHNLDRLLGGGLERGNSVAVIGPAGTGKSNISLLYCISAALRGERSAIYAFDERLQTILQRAKGTGMDLERHLESETIKIQQIDPAELTPGQFSNLVRQDVENGAQIIVIDSLSGFFHSMPQEHFLLLHLHELLSFTNQQGVISMLIVAQHGMLGTQMNPPVDISYVADTVLLLRYFEHAAEIRKAISTFKRRGGPHEQSIRELRITSNGVWIGETLEEFRGVLTGVPEFVGHRLAEKGTV